MKTRLRRSFLHNKVLNKDKKQLAFAPSSLILANNFLPVNRALGEKIMDDISDLIKRIQDDGHDVWMSTPASNESILQLESAIGFPLPSSLKQFLSTYGAIGIHDNFISGILDNKPLEIEGGNILGDTTFIKEDYNDLPNNYIVVQVHEDGAYCIDLVASNDDIAPVINYECGSSKKVADNFNEFLISHFLSGWANKNA